MLDLALDLVGLAHDLLPVALVPLLPAVLDDHRDGEGDDEAGDSGDHVSGHHLDHFFFPFDLIAVMDSLRYPARVNALISVGFTSTQRTVYSPVDPETFSSAALAAVSSFFA